MKNPPNATSEKSPNSVSAELSATHVVETEIFETEICGNQSVASFRDGKVAYAGRRWRSFPGIWKEPLGLLNVHRD